MKIIIKMSLWIFIYFQSLVLTMPVKAEHTPDSELDFYQLEQAIITTATRSEIKVKEAPAAVYIVTERQIRERGYRTLVEALHDIPGFDFQHTYGIFPELVHQRGMVGNNQRSLLYIDGILDNNIFENAILGGSLRYPLHNVKQIEIISGPASSLYGANAFNGLIHIKSGTNDNSILQIEGIVGTWMDKWSDREYSATGLNFFVQNNDKHKEFHYNVSGYWLKGTGPDFRSIQNLDTAGIGYYWSDYFNMSNEDHYSFNGQFTYKGIRFIARSWQYLAGDGTFANGTEQIDTDKLGYHGSRWNFRNTSIAAGYLYAINNRIKLDSEISLRHTDLLSSSFEQYPTSTGTSSYTQMQTGSISDGYIRQDENLSLHEKMDIKILDNLLTTIGLEYSDTSVPKDYGSYQRYTQRNIASYLQTVYHPLPILGITAGFRFDHNSDYDNTYTPRISAVFNPGDLTFKFLFSTGFRAPTAWELFSNTPQRKANPEITPEKMLTFETGVGYRFLKKFYSSMQIYYNQISDLVLELVSTELNPDPNYVYWNKNQNAGNAKVIGIEWQNDIRLFSNLDIFFNYTYSDGKFYDLQENLKNRPTVKDSLAMPTIAKHKANIGFTFYPLHDLSLHLRANFVHERETIMTNPTRTIDSYLLWHANIRWNNFITKRLYINLKVRNMADNRAWDPGIRNANGTYYPTAHPIEDRNFWISIGFRYE